MSDIIVFNEYKQDRLLDQDLLQKLSAVSTVANMVLESKVRAADIMLCLQIATVSVYPYIERVIQDSYKKNSQEPWLAILKSIDRRMKVTCESLQERWLINSFKFVIENNSMELEVSKKINSILTINTKPHSSFPLIFKTTTVVE